MVVTLDVADDLPLMVHRLTHSEQRVLHDFRFEHVRVNIFDTLELLAINHRLLQPNEMNSLADPCRPCGLRQDSRLFVRIEKTTLRRQHTRRVFA